MHVAFNKKKTKQSRTGFRKHCPSRTNHEHDLKQEFVRPRWPYDMRPSARAEKYIRDAGP